MAQDQDVPPILTDRYKTEYARAAPAPSSTPVGEPQFRDTSVTAEQRMARNQLPNPLTDRFQNGATSPGASTDTPAITRSSLPTSAPTNLQERARQNLQRALDGMSGLLGRPVTNPMPSAQPVALPAALPNILTTVPRLAPIATPAVPVGTPVAQPTPFSLDDWMAKQNSKG